jgi:protein tyrosine phosphatase
VLIFLCLSNCHSTNLQSFFQMEEGSKVNVREMLLEMRRYRMGLIQTADQLRFSYLAIHEGIKQLAEVSSSIILISE